MNVGGFLLCKGCFLGYTLLWVLLLGWREGHVVFPEETLQCVVCVVSLQKRKRTWPLSKWRNKGRWVRTLLITPQVMGCVASWESGSCFCSLPFSHFLTALKMFAQLPEVGSFSLYILWLISCLAQFRMHENHLRRIYKVSQFIQGIPSWITL